MKFGDYVVNTKLKIAPQFFQILGKDIGAQHKNCSSGLPKPFFREFSKLLEKTSYDN